MIILLNIIASIMVAGGFYAMWSGSQYIVLERGWSMVIAGSIFTSSGLIILAILQAFLEYQRFQKTLSGQGSKYGQGETNGQGATNGGVESKTSPNKPIPSRRKLVLPESPPMQAEAENQSAIPSEQATIPENPALESREAHSELSNDEQKPDLDADNAAKPTLAQMSSSLKFDARLIELEIKDIIANQKKPALNGHAHDPYIAEKPSEPQKQSAIPSASIKQAVSTTSPVEQADQQQGEAQHFQEKPVQEKPVQEKPVIGTYESGGNSYTMYEDGSVHANTSMGVYHFNSLDELKHFIATSSAASTQT